MPSINLNYLSSPPSSSFNATLRYIVDQRRESSSEEAHDRAREDDEEAERKVWEDAAGIEATIGRTTTIAIGDNSPSSAAQSVDSSKSSSSTSSNNEGDNDVPPIKNTPELEDEVSRRTKSTASQRKDLAIQTSEDRASRMRRERENPTMGKFVTTQRPLDGLFVVDTESGGRGYRPPVSSHGWGHAKEDVPDTSSANLVADAHYAKALRMLSSDFDRRVDGGNALVHDVRWGEYDQDTLAIDGLNFFDSAGGNFGASGTVSVYKRQSE